MLERKSITILVDVKDKNTGEILLNNQTFNWVPSDNHEQFNGDKQALSVAKFQYLTYLKKEIYQGGSIAENLRHRELFLDAVLVS